MSTQRQITHEIFFRISVSLVVKIYNPIFALIFFLLTPQEIGKPVFPTAPQSTQPFWLLILHHTAYYFIPFFKLLCLKTVPDPIGKGQPTRLLPTPGAKYSPRWMCF